MSPAAAGPAGLKGRVATAVAADGDRLVSLSHRVHGAAEVGFEEERSSVWCAEALHEAGYSIEMGAGDLPTAFAATWSGERPAMSIAATSNRFATLKMKPATSA